MPGLPSRTGPHSGLAICCILPCPARWTRTRAGRAPRWRNPPGPRLPVPIASALEEELELQHRPVPLDAAVVRAFVALVGEVERDLRGGVGEVDPQDVLVAAAEAQLLQQVEVHEGAQLHHAAEQEVVPVDV